MKIILACVLVIVLVFAGILVYKDFYVKQKLRKTAAQKFDFVEPLMNQLESKSSITQSEMLKFVKDPSMRMTVFRVLNEYQRPELFPSEYLTFEHGAEAALVNWLEYPTELGIPPAEIVLMTKVSLNDGEPLDYYVFKYRTTPPHWAAQWRLGVAGPYDIKSQPYDVPSKVYSRFGEVGTISPEGEARWVHDRIA
jgi:hypothetical protein